MKQYLYVLNSGEGTVSIIDADSTVEVKRVDLNMACQGRGAFLSPREAIADKKGQRIFILCPFDDLIICCDGNMKQVIFSERVASNPVSIVLSKDEKYCYVACGDSDCIMQLSAENGRQLAMVRTHPLPMELASDECLLCACMNGRCVTSYDLEELIPLNTLALRGMPFGIAVNGKTAVISQLMCNDEWNGCLSRVDTDGVIPGKSVRLNMAPGRICTTVNGYAVAENGGKRLRLYNYLLECTGEIETESIIEALLYNETTDSLYVSLPNSNSVAVYDCRELTERYTIHVGLEPSGMVIINREELE